jgi:hypothetical protein
MNDYLHRIAARGAGSLYFQVQPDVPSRFAQPYTPTRFLPRALAVTMQPEPDLFTESLPGQTRSAGAAWMEPEIARTPTAAARGKENSSAAARTPAQPAAPILPAPRAQENVNATAAEIRILPQPAPSLATFATMRRALDGLKAPGAPSVSTRESIGNEPTVPTAAPRVVIEPMPPTTFSVSSFVENWQIDREPTLILPMVREVTRTRVVPFAVRQDPPPASRSEVRVSIGRVDVRVEAMHTPSPPPKSTVTADPFASLALARRGWRAMF